MGRQPILLIVVRRDNRMNGRIGGERVNCRKGAACDGSGSGTIRHETYGPLRGCQGVNG